ncbi:hypothetical protein [Microbacterium gorillae]|uniref:hypothetical protein n=1 Tax=Microbacterium gorillae TaxID=1231063 RepID=UPI00058DD905|nr:hypothetical protein [Microbacterium gorillae]
MSAGTDAIDDAVRIAARAPSAHNTQPWSVHRDGDTLTVHVDPDRMLPAGDDTARDLLLAFGAWAEAFTIAAAGRGLVAVVESAEGIGRLQADPMTAPTEPLLVVRCRLGAADTVFHDAEILARGVNRGPLRAAPDAVRRARQDLPPGYELRAIPPHRFSALVAAAGARSQSDPTIARETMRWLRFTTADPGWTRDGLRADTLLLPGALARVLGLFTRTSHGRDRLGEVFSVANRVLATVTPMLPTRATTGLPLVLIADGSSVNVVGADAVAGSTQWPARLPADAVLNAGRVLMGTWLALQRRGVVVSPHSEVLDDPRSAARLRRGLRLRVAEVPLAVFDSGTPVRVVPRSARLTGE